MTRIQGRRTAKLNEGDKIAVRIGIVARNRDELYDELQKAGYNWDGKSKTWSKDNAWQGSAFEDAHGRATRHVKMRVMAHPDHMTEVIDVIQEALHDYGIVLSTPEKTYPMRKSPAVRVYMDGSIA